MGSYGHTGTIVDVTVATTGTYDITAYGAQGGGALPSSTLGGKGAQIEGQFTLTAGEQLEIVVGGASKSGDMSIGGGGGAAALSYSRSAAAAA